MSSARRARHRRRATRPRVRDRAGVRTAEPVPALLDGVVGPRSSSPAPRRSTTAGSRGQLLRSASASDSALVDRPVESTDGRQRDACRSSPWRRRVLAHAERRRQHRLRDGREQLPSTVFESPGGSDRLRDGAGGACGRHAHAALVDRPADRCSTSAGTASPTASRLPDYETPHGNDIRAVMDAAGSELAAIVGVSEGGASRCFAARTRAGGRSDPRRDRRRRRRRRRPPVVADAGTQVGSTIIEERSGTPFGSEAWSRRQPPGLSPSIETTGFQRWWRRSGAVEHEPGALTDLRRINSELATRHVLSSISVPTARPASDPRHRFGLRVREIHRRPHPGIASGRAPGRIHGWWVPPEPDRRQMSSLPRPCSGGAGEWQATGAFTDPRDLLFHRHRGTSARLAELATADGARPARPAPRTACAAARRFPRPQGRAPPATASSRRRSTGPARRSAAQRRSSTMSATSGSRVRAGLPTPAECEHVDGKVGGIAVHIGAGVAAEPAGERVSSRAPSGIWWPVGDSGSQERGAAELKGAAGRRESPGHPQGAPVAPRPTRPAASCHVPQPSAESGLGSARSASPRRPSELS